MLPSPTQRPTGMSRSCPASSAAKNRFSRRWSALFPKSEHKNNRPEMLDFQRLRAVLSHFIVSLCVQVLFFGILYVIFRKKYNDSKYRILSVGSVLGNVGFIGMPILASVFPDTPIVLVYSSINVMSMNLIVFTIGTYMITNDKRYVTFKNAILNPTTLAIIVAMPLFIFKVDFPEFADDAIGLLGKMVTPFCMFILGMRLSEASFVKIFTRPFVYITCALKLLVFPAFAFLIVHWIPFLVDVLKGAIVVLAMTPSGAVIESLAELHECEQDFAANVVLLTTILSVITIPLMVMLFV